MEDMIVGCELMMNDLGLHSVASFPFMCLELAS